MRGGAGGGARTVHSGSLLDEALPSSIIQSSPSGGVSAQSLISSPLWILPRLFPRAYRGTSLMRSTPLLVPYSRTLPRVLWWSWRGGLFLTSQVPLPCTFTRGDCMLDPRVSVHPLYIVLRCLSVHSSCVSVPTLPSPACLCTYPSSRLGIYPAASELRRNNSKGIRDLYVKAKARIWP